VRFSFNANDYFYREQLVGQIFIKSVVYEKNSLGSFLPFTITQALAIKKIQHSYGCVL
jgi:hypothetical protein